MAIETMLSSRPGALELTLLPNAPRRVVQNALRQTEVVPSKPARTPGLKSESTLGQEVKFSACSHHRSLRFLGGPS